MKLKTRKAAAKRFKFTATGKVNYKRAGMRHSFANKNGSFNMERRHSATLTDGFAKHIRRAMPYGS